MPALALGGETRMNPRARKRTASVARRFASVWFLWCGSCHALPLNFGCLICILCLRANIAHVNNGRFLRARYPVETGQRHRLSKEKLVHTTVALTPWAEEPVTGMLRGRLPD